ncbi:MAG: single-stranded DNA-binding protein [Acholeplasma sp.]|nr:single-stranded DNA-binding protein [Acholeplasma sp.]
MLNQLVLIGRVTHNPESVILDDGKKVLKCQIAVQRSFKNYDGEYDTDFISITAWEGLASVVENYLEKGMMIAVKGRVQTWQKEINEKSITMLEVIAERITYLSQSQKKLSKELED